MPSATVYDWTRLYRPGITTTGLSIPSDVLSSLPEENLEIDIRTRSYPSCMQVFDYLVKGESPKEIVINAHNCHPFQANDDISGCAVAIKLFQKLANTSNLRYSYRLLIAPELYGPMFWLDDPHQSAIDVLSVILLKSVGNSSH